MTVPVASSAPSTLDDRTSGTSGHGPDHRPLGGSPHDPPSATAPDGRTHRAAIPWVLPAIVVGLTSVAGFRQGAFWPVDALAVAIVSVVVVAVRVASRRLGSVSLTALSALGALAAWWFVRSLLAHDAGSFLPLGASILGFAAAYVAVRPLSLEHRQTMAATLATLGSLEALVGFVGLAERWFPMAMPAQGLWRLASTVTYSDAAGVILAVALLIALGCDQRRWLARVNVCLCLGGLVATQSRGGLLAMACAALIVPVAQYRRALTAIGSGLALGIVAVGTSSSFARVPIVLLALALSILVASAFPPKRTLLPMSRRTVQVMVAAVIVVAICGLLATHTALSRRIDPPSNGDRTAEWVAAADQWRSSPLIGVGPDRMLYLNGSKGTYAHFAHNEYLQVGADAGIVGIVLLLAAAAALVRSTRRRDVLASCGVAAAVALVVAGGVDFDWHLPVVGLLGGWALALGGDLS